MHFRTCSITSIVAASALALGLTACKPQEPAVKWPVATAPVAKIEAKQFSEFDNTRTDNYYWLRDDARKNEEVIKYLEAENAYTDTLMAPTKALRETLFQEIKGRIKQTDESVPYLLRGYYYYTRYEAGKNYRIYCRKMGSLQAAEEVMLDVNAEAVGKDYYTARVTDVSDDNNLAIVADNTVGDDVYRLRVKDLRTGKFLADEIPGVAYTISTWAADNKTILYAEADATQRASKIRRHTLGSAAKTDPIVYAEADSTFDVNVSRSRGEGYLIISSENTASDEVRLVPAAQPSATPILMQPREKDLKYTVEEAEGLLYIRTNWQAQNFRLMTAAVAKPTKADWKELIAHRPDVLIQRFELFKDYLVISERVKGLTTLQVISRQTDQGHYIDYQDPAYDVDLGINAEYNTGTLRFTYTSLTTPFSTYDYDMASKAKTLLKQQEVVGGTFKPEDYESKRLFANAEDGTQVPISLVYRKDKFKKGKNPLLVYAYGSYGATVDPAFNPEDLSLLDRGFVMAIAHVRGGQDMGRAWYEGGKLMQKKNTFTDFIVCTLHLINNGYGDRNKVIAQGGSAGGLLMGAISNMAPPGLYTGIIAEVPFVDVITTMTDPSIPLTTSEWNEWGNPITSKEAYEYMLSYSPYDQVKAQPYPHMLVTTSLNDSRVAYWEPAKWVAKLRTLKKDDHVLLLKTEMAAGHGGGSGRDKQYENIAFNFAFALHTVGIDQ